MQNIRYLQVTLWASLKTKNNGWLKSQETHFQVAITSAYACIFRIILQHVFLALLVSFSLLFLFYAGLWVSLPVLLFLWSKWSPNAVWKTAMSCGGFPWSCTCTCAVVFCSVSASGLQWHCCHAPGKSTNVCPSPKSMEERMYLATRASEQPLPCCRL